MFTPENSHPKSVQDAKNEFNQFGHQSDYDFVLKVNWATRAHAQGSGFELLTLMSLCPITP